MKKTLVITSLVLAFSFVSTTLAIAATPKIAVNNEQTKIATVKSKADAEIDRRVVSLNATLSLVDGIIRLNDSQKTTFSASINTQITNLNNLKTKIDADTDLATLRSDQKSIFDEYRIYMLYIPQTRILVAADRMSETAILMTQVASKIATRINGNTAWQAKLTDANTKIADATTQATNSINLVIGLVPDQGDATKAASNTAALKNARANLQTGVDDLKTARTDLQIIVNALKAQKPSPTPTSTTSAK